MDDWPKSSVTWYLLEPYAIDEISYYDQLGNKYDCEW